MAGNPATNDTPFERTAMTPTTTLTEQVWLLQNKLNPFPIAATMALRDDRLLVTLHETAADAVLGWLESALGRAELKTDLANGESITIFDAPVADIEVSWPKLYAGAWMQVDIPGQRGWTIALDYPSGGAILQTVSLMAGRKKGKIWKRALA